MRKILILAAKVTLGILVSLILGWLAIRGLDWTDVSKSILSTSPTLLLVGVGVFIAASYIRAIRWHILLTTKSVSINRLFLIQNAGIGINNIFPIRIASEIAQIALLTVRGNVSKSTAVTSIGMERLIDLMSSTFLLALGLSYVSETRAFAKYGWASFGATVTIILILFMVSMHSNKINFTGKLSFLSSLTKSMSVLIQNKLVLLKSLTLSIIYWIMVGITAWIVAQSVDISISPLSSTLVIMTTIFFATLIPAAPSAIGSFEWAMVYILGFLGVEKDVGFSYAVVTHTVFFLPPIIIAMIFLPREGMFSISKAKFLMKNGLIKNSEISNT